MHRRRQSIGWEMLKNQAGSFQLTNRGWNFPTAKAPGRQIRKIHFSFCPFEVWWNSRDNKSSCQWCMRTCRLLLRCLWKGREVALEQTVFHEWWDLWFASPPLPIDAILCQPSTKYIGTKVNAPRDTPPPLMCPPQTCHPTHKPQLTCHPFTDMPPLPRIVHGHGGNEYLGLFGPNLYFPSSLVSAAPEYSVSFMIISAAHAPADGRI